MTLSIRALPAAFSGFTTRENQPFANPRSSRLATNEIASASPLTHRTNILPDGTFPVNPAVTVDQSSRLRLAISPTSGSAILDGAAPGKFASIYALEVGLQPISIDSELYLSAVSDPVGHQFAANLQQLISDGLVEAILDGDVLLPGDISPFPPTGFADAALVSVDIDGITERIGDSSFVDPGFGDAWTLSLWYKPKDTVAGTLIDMPGVGSVYTIAILAKATEFQIDARNNTGELRQRHTWGTLVVGAWTHLVVTWNGTSPVVVYENGIPVVPNDSSFDLSLTMDVRARRTFIGCNNSGAEINGVFHAHAQWDVALDASTIASIYNSGRGAEVDLNALATPPLHWWRLGHDSADIGKDEGNAALLRDMMDSNVDITVDDIVFDVPE